MKTVSAIAIAFASLVLLLDVDASVIRSGQPSSNSQNAERAGHVGEGINQPL